LFQAIRSYPFSGPYREESVWRWGYTQRGGRSPALIEAERTRDHQLAWVTAYTVYRLRYNENGEGSDNLRRSRLNSYYLLKSPRLEPNQSTRKIHAVQMIRFTFFIELSI